MAAIAALCTGFSGIFQAAAQEGIRVSLLAQVQERLRNRTEAAGIPPQIAVGKELIYASIALPLFYERRGYLPAWSDEAGPLPLADSLIEAISRADQQGLRPADYHYAKIKSTHSEVRLNQNRGRPLNPGRLVDLDLLLTDAFLIYGSHLLSGRVDPLTIDSEWLTNLRQLDMAAALENALRGNCIGPTLDGFLPPQPGYSRLREALGKYRLIANEGGWPEIPNGPKLQKGDAGERVTSLRSRLTKTGDSVDTIGAQAELFDDALDLAVRRYQGRNGLEIDGVVGRKTLEELNVPVEKRINQIVLNMERWRWLPQELGQNHVLVNIANFELDVFENGNVMLGMRVIVGKPYQRTPVFSDNITYIVFNPYWNVPPNIADKEVLPALQKNPKYLAEQNMQVLQGWGADMKALNPDSIDWKSVAATNSSYWFRQLPGPGNSLGQIKFMFPNQFNVYLHDTPSRGLFAKSSRSFSHGCIRIEKPVDLAAYLLSDNPKWTRDDIAAAMKTNLEQTVRLPKPMPIHILYWTTWASADGEVNFRDDLYKRDPALLAAFTESPPKIK